MGRGRSQRLCPSTDSSRYLLGLELADQTSAIRLVQPSGLRGSRAFLSADVSQGRLRRNLSVRSLALHRVARPPAQVGGKWVSCFVGVFVIVGDLEGLRYVSALLGEVA